MTGFEKACWMVAVFLMAAVFGALVARTSSTRAEATKLEDKASKAEADARTAIAARYRAEEELDALKDAAETSKALALYEQEQKLREALACKR